MANMNLSADKLRLKAELLYSRQGVLPFVAALLLVLAVLFGVLVVPGQIAAKDHAERELDKLVQQQKSLRGKPAEKQLSPAQNLARALADPEVTNAQIRALQDFAANSGVHVLQADFRRVEDTQHAYTRLQISLPVKADYPSLRRFLYSILTEMPALSLDQLVIKREQANSGQLEAQLVMSLWQKAAPVSAEQAAAGGSN
ncbi:GspMb/PilO family protein [Uliginosibacterium sp. H3]|uniref:GspMb/PilO family protein n=1 Tax=Uliginosibacterium silvisoli TaxID=3114758 RepID=A0ABU6K607_9RHOO|nr:GspMb/PilO family protein [Uliginosibacterium sp. H3]